jgi:penicillin-insensitive murein endopeptidase
LVGDGHAKVTHLFVATPIRERLLAYAARIGAPPGLRSRASEVLAQPHGSLPHDDHFHVRVACPSGMDKCIEQPVAHHHGRGGAVASHGHAAHPSSPHSAPPSHAAPAPAHGGPPAEARPRPAAKPEARKEEPSAADSLVPSLSPSVPGLDSAVIPAPLGGGGVRSTWGTAKDPKADPISDPDGVLEHN